MAQFASKEAIANTPRSPRFNNNITQSPNVVKPEADNFNSTESDSKRRSRSKRDMADTKEKVTLGMTDSERTRILSKKKIVAPIYEGQADKLTFATVYFENLLGGFVDGENFVPVRFGLKHSANSKATLYVMVDQNSISTKELSIIKKTEVLNAPALQKQTPEAPRSVTYSVPQIISLVNRR